MADKDTTVNWLSDEDQAAMQPETFANPMVKALMEGAAKNAAVPGQVMAQNPYPEGSEEWHWFEGQRQGKMYDWAPKEALSLATGGMQVAQPGSLGIFGGRFARNADLQAKQAAEEMVKRGALPDDVWAQTGWMRHPADKLWRYEIPDNKLKLSYMPQNEGDTAIGSMSSLVKHPELFEAYPQFKNVDLRVTRDSSKPAGTGVFDTSKTEYPRTTAVVNAPNMDVARSVLAHELQHGVQSLEKFSYGANPNYYQDLIGKGLERNPSLMPNTGSFEGNKKQLMDIFGQAFPLYKKTAGEVEARNVQDRLDWGPGKRQRNGPWWSQDTPYQDQVHYDPWGPNEVIQALRNK